MLNKKEKKAVETFVYNCQEGMTNALKALVVKKAQEDGEVAAGLADHLFSNPNYLQIAWKIVGFPFAILNKLYKKVRGIDHPAYKLGFRENSY